MDIESRLNLLPRVALAQLPTPLERCERLSEEFGREIWLKRDDLSGLAFGGNKTRQFEYLLGAAVAERCDTVVVGPYAAQSNYCRQLSAACAKLGLRARLVLRAIRQHDQELQGNLMLDVLLGADVSVHDLSPERHAELVAKARAEELAAGRRVYDPEAHAYLAAVAYVHAGLELFGQLAAVGVEPGAVYLAAAGESQAGLLLAARALNREVRVVGANPGVTWWDVPRRVLETGNEAAARLQLGFELTAEEIISSDEFGAPGYGMISEAALAAIRTLAAIEGVLLDPVYTSKAMALLFADLERDAVPDGPVVFVHTGGLPALFHYREALGLPAVLNKKETVG